MPQPVALVTGAASGLGLATAQRLAAAGYFVIGLDKKVEPGHTAWTGIHGLLVSADVTSETDVAAALKLVAERGELRVAVNCAGVGWASRMISREGEPHALDLFRTIIEINLIGTFNVLRLAAAAMAKNTPDAQNQRGVLISTASVAAYDGQIGQVAYSASKGAVAAMTLPIARDLAATGIRAITIAPGIFDTPMVAALPEKVRESIAAGIPNPSRLGRPEEYADLVAFIASSPYLNGEVIRFDGAVRLAPR